MNKNTVFESIKNTAGTILEDSAYLFTASLEDGFPDVATWQAQGIALSYTDDDRHISGEIHMWYPPEISTIAAANMLGVDETDEKALSKGDDALREILNILAGNLLTELYGEDVLFNLTVPYEIDQNQLVDDEASDYAVWLETEDYPVLIVLHAVENR
jgi:hypothetical protein